MRLICPSCGAQYEVPPEAIPPTGREVQCSSCQRSWFERGAAPPPRLLDPLEGPPVADADEEEALDLAEVRSSPPPQSPPRPRVTPEVSRILREEAEREQAARSGNAARPATESATIRRLHPRDAPTADVPRPPEPATARPPRSTRTGELDLDQINATLRSPLDRAPVRSVPSEARPRPSGFGRGFWSALLVLAILAGAYAFRPQIVAALPATAAVLDPYAGAVDRGRDWLNRQVGRVLGATSQ